MTLKCISHATRPAVDRHSRNGSCTCTTQATAPLVHESCQLQGTHHALGQLLDGNAPPVQTPLDSMGCVVANEDSAERACSTSYNGKPRAICEFNGLRRMKPGTELAMSSSMNASKFASTVKSIAASAPSCWKFGQKVYIAYIWSQMPVSMDRATFSSMMIAAHRDGTLVAARADCMPLLDVDMVQESELQWGKTSLESFHFVRADR